jgi:ABC-2 type transport system permease protein
MLRNVLSKKNRALLAELVRTDFKLRYQGSVLGYAWSLLRPLLLFVILYIVFVRFLKIGNTIPHYPVYLLLGIVVWSFFNEMTTRSITAIVEQGDLIRKIRIPRWIIILSSSLSALINLAFNHIVVAVFMIVNHADLLRTTLWLPLILLEVYVLALGLSLILSASYVKYRDVTYIWEVIMQAGFYLTPIIYPLTKVPSLTFQKIIMLNPMSQAIQDARYSTITHQAATISPLFQGGPYKYIPYLLPVVIVLVGIKYFRKQSKYFAENV